MRTVELLTPSWTFAVPRDWEKFEVRFSNDLKTGFMSFRGAKFMALKGSQLRGAGPKVNALFDAMVKQGFAREVELVTEKLVPEVRASGANKKTGHADHATNHHKEVEPGESGLGSVVEKPVKRAFLTKTPVN